MNKKGSTFEGWTEGIMFSVLFVIVLGTIVFAGMNVDHDGDLEIAGLDTEDIENTFETFQSSQQEKIDGGDASFESTSGLTLSTSWDMIRSVLSLTMGFVAGGWMPELTSYLQLPSIVGIVLRGLWIIALTFIVLGAIFHRKI